ncbi:MAG: arsenate reductase ArsC [Paracoccaceae bacterium]
MPEPLQILILCTGNSARSILAEAAFNLLGQGRVRAFSAGSRPTGQPHPLALALLAGKGIDTGFARSKSWDEFAGPQAPRMDLVITVCDSAAAETCPFWPGAPVRAHWGLPDPAAVTGAEAARAGAFARTWAAMERRVRALLDLPFETLDAPALKAHLDAIGAAPD